MAGRSGPPPAAGHVAVSCGIALDLGTDQARVAVAEGGDAALLPDAEGTAGTPAAAMWSAGGVAIVGHAARRLAVGQREGAVRYVAQLLGRRADDPALARLPAALRARLVPSTAGPAALLVDGVVRQATEVAAALLAALVDRAADYVGRQVVSATLVVPLGAAPAWRSALADAAAIAGLADVTWVAAPVGAAAWARQRRVTGSRLLVVDVGGGGTEVAVVEARGQGSGGGDVGDVVHGGNGSGVSDMGGRAGVGDVGNGGGVGNAGATGLTVVGQASDAALGGLDLDRTLAGNLLASLGRDGAHLAHDPGAEGRLWDAAEAARLALARQPAAAVHLPFLGERGGAPVHLNATLDAAALAAAAAPLAARLTALVRAALADAGGRPPDRVVLMGGLAAAAWVSVAVRAGLPTVSPGATVEVAPADAAVRGAAALAAAGEASGGAAAAGTVDPRAADGAAGRPDRSLTAAVQAARAAAATARTDAAARAEVLTLHARATGLLYAAERAVRAAGPQLDSGLAATAAADIGRLRGALRGEGAATLAARVAALAVTAQRVAATLEL